MTFGRSDNNCHAKLGFAKAEAIRWEWHNTSVQMRTLAGKYHVTLGTIKHVIHGRIWKPHPARYPTSWSPQSQQ